MSAHKRISVLLFGLLLLQCCTAAMSAQAAQPAEARHTEPKPHRHIPRMDVEQQKYQSSMQEGNDRASMQQVVPLAPLNPNCVPKYATDLVVPPPMPLATPPLVAQSTKRQDRREQDAAQTETRSEHAHNPDRLSYANADTIDEVEVEPRRPSKRGSRYATASAEARERRAPSFHETKEWEFRSTVRDREQDSTSEEVPSGVRRRSSKAPKPVLTEDVPLISLDDEYHQAMDMGDELPRRNKPRRASDSRSSRDEPHSSIEEEMEQDANQRGWFSPDNPRSRTPDATDPKKAPAAKPKQVVPAPAPAPAPIPPVVRPTDYYDVSVRQVSQAVLPPTPNVLTGCPATFAPTQVYAYGPRNIANQPFHFWPGFTIEAQRNVPAHIRWTNDLVDAAGGYSPHLLRDSIDQTIHWANPAALGGLIDHNPCHLCSLPGGNCATDPACVTAATTTYTGPVPSVTHVHGQQQVYDFSDGYTEAWTLPAANNLAGFTPVGTWYNTMQAGYTAVTAGATWRPGSLTSIYRNTQPASTSWYHDHTLGLTRTNVFAGLAGFYLVREKFPSLANGPELPGIPYPAYDGVIPINQVRELPLAIQDRSFTTDSQLWYPVAAHAAGTTLPTGPLHPRWIPEYSATVVDPVTNLPVNMVMMAVNGRTYPKHVVYPDAYRLRLLNGCNSRTLQLRFATSANPQINPLDPAQVTNLLPFYVIGNEAGFYPQLQVPHTSLQMGPAQRFDVIIDFSGLQPGQFVFMLNNGPETDTAIYNGANNGVGLTVHTSQIMRFDVTAPPAGMLAAVPFSLTQQMALNNAMAAYYAANVPPLLPPPVANPLREVALLESLSPAGFPLEVLLGTATGGAATPQLWMDPVRTDVPIGTGQVWDIINLSADSHPIHLHNVDFRFVGRFALTLNPAVADGFVKTTTPVTNADLDPLLTMPCLGSATGLCNPPMDTILVLPGSYTRIAFNTGAVTGLYAWHCHLVEHEDNEMMVPFCFGQPGYPDPHNPAALMCPGPN